MLIFEDLHWADATSLRLFAFFAAELEDSSLLVLGTYRDTELSRQHPMSETLAELARSSVFHRIELAGLTSRETEEFIAAAAGGTASAGLVSAIHARTEGHPLFLEETLRFMMEGRTQLAVGSVGDDARLLMKIPSGVREVIGKRLNRLSVGAAGCWVSPHVLAGPSIWTCWRSWKPTSRKTKSCWRSRKRWRATDRAGARVASIPVRPCLDPRDPLRRNAGPCAAHGCTCVSAKCWSSATAPTSDCAPQLAYHFSEGGPGGAAVKALAYAKHSAEHATQLLAFEEAARLYRLALHLQQQHFAKDTAQRCNLVLGLGEVEMSLGAGEQARAAYQEAADLARDHGLAAPFAQAALGFEASNAAAARSGEPAVALLLEAIALHQANDPIRVELLARLCRAYVYCDRADEAKEAHRAPLRWRGRSAT